MWTLIDHGSCPCDYNYSMCGLDISELEYVGDYRETNIEHLCKECLYRLDWPCWLCGKSREEYTGYYEGEENQRGTLSA